MLRRILLLFRRAAFVLQSSLHFRFPVFSSNHDA